MGLSAGVVPIQWSAVGCAGGIVLILSPHGQWTH